jgi:hypothetical protein
MWRSPPDRCESERWTRWMMTRGEFGGVVKEWPPLSLDASERM